MRISKFVQTPQIKICICVPAVEMHLARVCWLAFALRNVNNLCDGTHTVALSVSWEGLGGYLLTNTNKHTLCEKNVGPQGIAISQN